MKRLWALLDRAGTWAADALEASHHGQREHFGAEPSTLDTYDPPDSPRHRKDTTQ